MPITPAQTAPACTAPQTQLDAYKKIVADYDAAKDKLETKRQELGDQGWKNPTPEQASALDELGRPERELMGKMLDAWREMPEGCKGALESPFR